MRSGPSCNSIGAVHSDLVAPVLEPFDNLSGPAPKFVGAASAPVLILDKHAIADGEILHVPRMRVSRLPLAVKPVAVGVLLQFPGFTPSRPHVRP